MVYAKALATAQEDREDAEKAFIEKAKDVFKRLEREIEATDEKIRIVEGSK